MIRIIIFITTILYTQIASSQDIGSRFYIVNDPDGWVNIRQNDKTIIDRVPNNTIVYAYSDGDDQKWLPIEYKPKGSEESQSGLIHKSRLQSLTTLERIPVSRISDRSYTFSNRDFFIKIDIEPFSLKGRVVKYSDEGAAIEHIDGEYTWGVDGNTPTNQFKSIEIINRGASIIIPNTALKNLFQPSPDYIEIYYNRKGDILYIVSSNSDGAGSYMATWTIENGKYKERFVTHGF